MPGLRRVRASIDRNEQNAVLFEPLHCRLVRIERTGAKPGSLPIGRLAFSIGGGCDATDGFFAA